MRTVKIITVCGAGTVGSVALAERLRKILDKKSYIAQIAETSPAKLESMAPLDGYDMIVSISPISRDFTIPVLNGTGFMLGLNEDEFVDKFMDVVGKLNLFDRE